jgi:hypothetical protein
MHELRVLFSRRRLTVGNGGNVMRTKKRLVMSLVLGATAMSYAGSASAQEYVLILLDQTGSMCSNLSPCASDSPWANAINAAAGWVADDFNTDSSVDRYYSIWTFKNTQDSVQNGAVQLWPSDTFNTSCPSTAPGLNDIGQRDAASGFCHIKLGSAQAYNRLTQVLIPSIREMSGQVPQATWLTPLADSLCRSFSKVWLSNSQANRTLILESDGGENSSTAAGCLGDTATNASMTWDAMMAARTAGTADWGWLPAGSGTGSPGTWQANVIRRGARITSFLPGGGLFDSDANFSVSERDAVLAGVLTTSDNFPPPLTLKVSPIYTLCAAGDTDPVCVHKNGTTMMSTTSSSQFSMLQFPGTGATVVMDGPASHPVTAFSTFGATAMATTAATSSTGAPRVPTMDPPELSFFRTIGSTPRSKLREVVRDPGGVYGRGHAIQGDVDDSLCTSQADYSIVTQKDVWMQRAVRPLEIAIRADLNRDGWVNQEDRAIVLANWGKGCANPPGPRPIPIETCGDGIKNAAETDVDCGSSSCSDCKVGKACLVNSDCLSDSCVGNVCATVNNISGTLAITQDWGGGYCVEVGATNRHATKTTTNWSISVATGDSAIYQIWGGTRVGNTGTVVLRPGAGNTAVRSGATNVNVGFCANRTVAGAAVFPTVTATTATY